jgi:uncharacterized repeat protein (TIGR03803 family)
MNLISCKYLRLFLAGAGLLPLTANAQILTTLHSFAGYPSDGVLPMSELISSSNTLYGTTEQGGTAGSNGGTVFKINNDGTGYTNLYSFANGFPFGGLVLSSNTLYGMTYNGGSSGQGAIFAINTDGTGFTNLYSFTPALGSFATNSDGAHPRAGLILSSNTLYGAVITGGSAGNGTIFAVNTDGTGFTNLHNFTTGHVNNATGLSTNSDGIGPNGLLVLSGSTLFGWAMSGGTLGCGTIFAVNTDGTGFTNVHNFAGNGIDAASPSGSLVLIGNRLYGTTFYSFSGAGNGTVFAVNTDGSGFANLHNFSSATGANPAGRLILSGNTLFGTSQNSKGAVFAINTDGTGFTNIYKFTGSPVDGSQPVGGVTLVGTTLYGTTLTGGVTSGPGTVFSLSLLPPRLAITPSGTDVILSWPTYTPGVSLQSTTNLVPPAIWTNCSPATVFTNGQNQVTDPIVGSQKFYRLIQ